MGLLSNTGIFSNSDFFRIYNSDKHEKDQPPTEWISLGDRGYLGKDNCLYVVGRIKGKLCEFSP